MKSYLARMVTGLLSCCVVLANWSFASAQEFKEYSIEQFLETTSFSGASFSPDQTKLLVSSDETGISNVYSIDVKSGEMTQLTESTVDSYSSLGYFPQDERFLYTADQGGNELNHVYVRMEDGTSKDLTPGENLRAMFSGWSQDDKYFYVSTNERNPSFFDMYRYKVLDLERELIFQNDGGYFPGSISPDGKWLALAKLDTRDNSNTFLYNIEDKTTKLITEHEGDINYSPATFTVDGKKLLLSTDKDSEFLYLISYDMANGDTETIFQVDWDVTGASFSKNGKYFGVGINQDSKSEIKLFEYESMTPVAMPSIAGAGLASLSISDDESSAAMYATSGRMPRDLFYYDIENEPRQLTNSLNKEINPDHLVNGEVVRFKSFDGVEIPGVLYKPQMASESNKVPALVWVHGGPGGQSTVGYRGLIQYLVNHGYAVYAINNRGSSGYGRSFQQMDDQAHGEGDLDDCVTSKKMLIETGYVDPDRIGIIGGSYGGYMVCAALAFRPEEFEVGVNIFGVTNWVRTLKEIPPWWEAQKKSLEKEMGDFDNVEYLKKISPLFHAENMKRPFLVLQGANDPRVLKIESDEIVEAVRKNGVPVQYEVFEDEGHGFRKKKNQLRGYKAILEFCDKYLKGKETSE